MPFAHKTWKYVLLAVAAAIAVPVAAKDAPRPTVAASILPLYSLLANLVDKDSLLPPLLPATASPHSYALRPSEARRLREADVIFWIGPALEGVLVRPIAALPDSVRVVALSPVSHTADADPHLWLDPVMAGEIVERMAAALSEADPARAADYRTRSEDLRARLRSLNASLDAQFAPVRTHPFVTAHNAYHYLVARFGLNTLGALSLSAEQPASARHLSEIRARMRAENAHCLVAEPQYQSRAIAVVAQDTGAQITLLDPLGSGLEPGPDAYFTLMTTLAGRMISCLGAPEQ